ncbi:GNAT family N-acetyltransferase [Miniphocaeibacter massiliensis]|uniref:GNAT family N-acetyltransferase n=1 Tax=Miniphocaeibacter massiliensis TaxID=2041841 RepID=UPI000C074C92|nr:GNAT family protein [Miniphocaeibacter massiliensis]
MLNHCGTKRIELDRLILRKFEHKDNQDMLDYWISDEKIQNMYAEPVYSSREEVKELLDKYNTSYKNNNYYRWAVIEKQSNICIGQISIYYVDSENHYCEIEYCIGSKFQGNGYCTEVVKTILKYSFENINLNRVQVSHKENNIASKKVIEKCGFVYEGTLRDYFYDNGKYIDRLYYSILKNEWS